MNFYPHHIGDFNNSTRHLTRVERSVYRDAIELYYDTESLLSVDVTRLQKKLICRSDEEKQALIDVLEEFFTLQDDGYAHVRCDSEIAKYRANIGAKAKAGIASAKARKLKAAERQQKSTPVKSRSTPVHNQEPLTINQEPIKNKQKIPPTAEFDFEEYFNKFWSVWPKRGDTRKSALVKFKTKCKDLDTFNKIMSGLDSQLPQFESKQNNFIPSATTWLNQDRWKNDPEPIETQVSKFKSMSDSQLQSEFDERGWNSIGMNRFKMADRLEAGA